MSKVMQQISVSRVVDGGIAAFVTWVAKDPRVKVGSIIVFKDPDLKNNKWTVTNVYDKEVEADEIDYRQWDNNDYSKHKGLGL